MKTLILTMLLLAPMTGAQMIFDDAVRARGFATPAEAGQDIYALSPLRERTSIIPVRGRSYLTGQPVETVTYVTLRQSLMEDSDAPAGYSNVPDQSRITYSQGWVAGDELATLTMKTAFPATHGGPWTCVTYVCAKAFYDSLTPLQRGTAILLATAVPSAPWVVLYQEERSWVEIP